MEGICHQELVSESSARGLRRLEVVRNRKVLVDQAQVQQTLNKCVNHFNKVPENQSDVHPKNWNYQPHRILPKRLKLYAYKVQILQELKPNDGPKCKAFAMEMLSRIEDDEDYLKKVMFTEKVCFHVWGKVNQHNARIWGSENPHVVIEHVRDSPQVNV